MKLKNLLLSAVLLLAGYQAVFAQCNRLLTPQNINLPCGTTCTTLRARVGPNSPQVLGTGVTSNTQASYVIENIPYNPCPLSGTSQSINIDDRYAPAITPLPFTFYFYGTGYNNFIVSGNGYISFNTTGPGAYAPNSFSPWAINNAAPNVNNPLNCIMAPWHDIDPGVGGQVRTNVQGTAPNRCFVISWVSIPMFSAACNALLATHQIKLYEGTNIIDIVIQSKPLCAGWNGGQAIEGITNATGTIAHIVPGRNSATQWQVTNDGKRFKPVIAPNANSGYNVVWVNSTGTQIGTGDSISVCPATTPTYYVSRITMFNGANNYLFTDTFNVTSPPNNLTLAPPSINDVLCFGDSTGSIEANPLGGALPYSFVWNNGDNDSIANNIPAGAYTVTVTDAALCVVTATYSVSQPPTPVTVDSGQVVNIACFGDSTGSITAFASGGVGNKTYTWSTGFIGQTITGLGPGTYTVTAADALACDDTAVYLITQPATAVSIQLDTIVNVLCFSSNNGSITVTGSGGAGNIHYAWGTVSPADTLATLSGLTAGNYAVTVSDDNGCIDTASYDVLQPSSALQLFNPTITPVTCFAGSDGAITSNPVGGTTPYSFVWSNTANTAAITSLTSANYDITVTDANGCTDTASYFVNQPTDLVISSTITDISCFGGNNGVINVSHTGGTGIPTYAWTQAANANTYTGNLITGLTADTYTAIATDQNGCNDTTTHVVNQPAGSVVINSSTITDVTCFGGSNGGIAVTASGGTGVLVYSWTTVSSGGFFGDTLTGISSDTFDLNVTDDNGCAATATYFVAQPTPIIIAPIYTNPLCAGQSTGSIDANASGGTGALTYAWSNGLPPAQVQTAITANIYTVTVTDGSLCQVSATLTLNEPAALTLNQPALVNVACFGNNTGSIAANITGGTLPYNATWTQLSSGGSYSGLTINNLTADTYNLLVTDLNGCQDTAAYVITQPSAPLTLDSSTFANITCFGYNNGNVRMYVSGGSPPYQFIYNGDTTLNSTRNNLVPGPVNVEVRDVNGCNLFQQFNIFEPTQVVIGLPIITNANCNSGSNGSISITAYGGTPDTALATGYNYLWTANSGSQTAPTASNLSAGTYTVTVSDGLGCFASETYTVTEPTALTANPIVTDVSCFGGDNGSIDANPSGGTTPYQFLWNDNSTQQVLLNVPANLYSAIVTDANGCFITTSAIVSQPGAVTINTTETPVGCPGTATGTLTATITGGTPPYTFSVSPDGSNFIFSPDGFFPALEAGDYVLYVADANSCVRTKDITIPEALPDEFTYETDSTSCYGNNYDDGAIYITGLNVFNMPYEYSLDGGLTQYSGDFYYVGAGLHTITAYNRFGCPTEIQVIVEEPLPIVVDVNPDTVFMTPGESAQAIVTFINATNVTYNWTPASGLSCSDCFNPYVTVYQPSEFTVEVAMVNGTATCYGYATLHAEVGQPDPVFVPNTFTPNGDGNNDFFLVYGNDIRSVSMRVFNRWGEKVFESSSVFEGWDGTYRGVKVNPDVYTYDVDIKLLTGKDVRKSGTVTLIR